MTPMVHRIMRVSLVLVAVLSALTVNSHIQMSGSTAHASAVADTSTVAAQANTASPSGQAMPVGDLPGWHQIFADDFLTPVSTGSFPGSAYGNNWSVYSNGTPDTSGNGRYYPSKVLSVANGMLNIYLHTENGIHMVAAALPKLPTMTYGRYSVRFRADTLYGYKTAWLLWPDSNSPTGGEVDLPESCTGLDGVICAFLHYANSSGRDYYGTGTGYGSWHTATIEWSPGKCTFIFDGQTLGTSTNGVPTNPMHWVLQTETATWGEGAPSSTESGNVQVDWVTAYSYAPGTQQTNVSIGCTSGGANPAATHAGWTEYLGTEITASQLLSGALVSFEVYNSSGTRVYQTASGSLILAANVGQWVTNTWNIPAGEPSGTYTVKILAYGLGWSPLYASTWGCSSFTIS